MCQSRWTKTLDKATVSECGGGNVRPALTELAHVGNALPKMEWSPDRTFSFAALTVCHSCTYPTLDGVEHRRAI
jgi:hypothetical protein